jgi:hypothetical protein
VKVDPANDRVVFQLYGAQQVKAPEAIKPGVLEQDTKAISHAIAKIPLEF